MAVVISVRLLLVFELCKYEAISGLDTSFGADRTLKLELNLREAAILATAAAVMCHPRLMRRCRCGLLTMVRYH
jgi:alkylhydroperoxidase family enzyme